MVFKDLFIDILFVLLDSFNSMSIFESVNIKSNVCVSVGMVYVISPLNGPYFVSLHASKFLVENKTF